MWPPDVMLYPLHLWEKGQKHVFLHNILQENTRNTKTCMWTNFGVENSSPIVVFRILENLTNCCDVISGKFRQKRQKHAFLHNMCWGTLETKKTCMWTNFGVENWFPVLVFRILKYLTTYCDIIAPKCSQKQVFLHLITPENPRIRKFVPGLISG